MRMLFLVFFLFMVVFGFPQSPVQDKANNGQLKRMVYERWDDWQPTPETNWAGLPKDPEGWFYWRVLHRQYYRGEDRRPYRPGGTFLQNYGSLTLQQLEDNKITDSMQKVAASEMATYVSMSGGDADVAWKVYFREEFEQLFNQVDSRLSEIAGRHPVAAKKMLENKGYLQYREYLAITQDRLYGIHHSYVDRGDRIVSYLHLLKDLRYRNAVMLQMISNYIKLTSLPPIERVSALRGKRLMYENDAAIVKHILSTFKF